MFNRTILSASLLIALVVSGHAAGQCPPNRPGSLNASQGVNCVGVDLNWPNVSGASHYNVYRSNVHDSATANFIGFSNNSNYTDLLPAGGEHKWYWVTSVRNLCLPGERESNYSPAAEGWVGSSPAVPAMLPPSVDSNTAIRINFQTVSGATDYDLWRSPTDDRSDGEIIDMLPIINEVTNTGFFLDYTVEPPSPWTYWVRARTIGCGAGDWSEPARWRFLRVDSGLPCDPITLRWPMFHMHRSYEVYRDGEVLIPVWTADPLHIWDYVVTDDLVDNGQHSYDIRIGELDEWQYSNRVIATFNGVKRQEGVVATRGTECSVVVTWESVVGATGYIIYRDFELIGHVAAQVLTFVDDPPTDQHYIYTVRAESDFCGEGPPDEDFGYTLPRTQITSQPSDALVTQCEPDAVFRVTTTGASPQTFQWRHGGAALADGPTGTGSTISGSATPVLTIANASQADAGAYRVRITDACTTLNSDYADLTFVTVTNCPCSPDFDGDGDTGTDADIEAFLACVGGNCCATCGNPDFDNDGDTGTDSDIEAFFRVLGGGSC